MEYAGIIARQLLLMCVYMAIGYVFYRKKFISGEGSKALSRIVLYLATPCVILKSYITEYSAEKAQGLLWAALFSLGALLVSMLTAHFIFGKKGRVDNFAASFSNAGFMGLPLVQAALGEEALFYAAIFIALLNLLQWTYGAVVLTGKKDAVQAKKIIMNPIVITLVASLVLFFTQVKVPAVAVSGISALAGLNAPLAMLVLGVYLAQTKLKEILTDKRLYFVCAVRLLAVPLLTLLLLLAAPSHLADMRVALIIVAAAPVGANVAVFAQLYDLDYTYAVKTVCLSTLLCIVTMPALMLIAERVL